MKKEFILRAKVTISVYTRVVAETLEEAILIANNEREMMSIVSNRGDNDDYSWMCDELDGEPYDIVLEKETDIIPKRPEFPENRY